MSWSWPYDSSKPLTYNNFPVKSYPTLIVGKSPWENTPSTSQNFPAKVSGIDDFKVSYSFGLVGNQNLYNVAFSFWVGPDPSSGTQGVADEIMVWVHTGFFTPDGSVIGSFKDSNGTAQITNSSSEKRGWEYTAYQYSKDALSGTIDVGAILKDLTARGIVDKNQYLLDMEVGSEVAAGRGGLTVNSLSYTLNNHSDTSNPGTGSGGTGSGGTTPNTGTGGTTPSTGTGGTTPDTGTGGTTPNTGTGGTTPSTGTGGTTPDTGTGGTTPNTGTGGTKPDTGTGGTGTGSTPNTGGGPGTGTGTGTPPGDSQPSTTGGDTGGNAGGTPTSPMFSITDQTTGTHRTAQAEAYKGPVASLKNQFMGSDDNEAVVGTADNDFINAKSGMDAIDAKEGDDVLDGGTGSNFLTGGAGTDTFFVDGRGGDVTWSTITDLQQGEWVIAWGWKPDVSTLSWAEMEGTGASKGATAHIDLDGNGSVDMSITFSGMASGALIHLPGQTGDANYLAFQVS
ncbi:GH12 family glycosyl hydrolase domain-containing protein [Azospirillum canadense]|uniref:GH12 family glycosyl hydrolase domain-containing protein n=1 Tax=Azospirillum canadense TaxID=403962 RepID=UPI002225DF5E|nr:hypothetical protein [Azospirillum canadense]MCW2244258.1 hypothetical protein [Azospirillum canadense]